MIETPTAITLKQLRVGDSGRVVGFGPGPSAYRRKLLSFGLTPGTALVVVRCAPLGDPVEIRIRGFSLTLRRDEAESLLVET